MENEEKKKGGFMLCGYENHFANTVSGSVPRWARVYSSPTKALGLDLVGRTTFVHLHLCVCTRLHVHMHTSTS